MADDRDSDLGDDSPVGSLEDDMYHQHGALNGTTLINYERTNKSVRSEGETSGEQSCDSSDEGVGVRDAPATHPMQNLHQPPLPGPLQLNHQPILNHQQMNNHQNRNSPRQHEREMNKVRDDFESLKSSLHPHLSSLASIAQGAPLATPSNVFALAGGGPGAGFPYAQPAFLTPAPPPPAQPAGSASSTSSEGSAAGWSFEEQYKQVRQVRVI